MIEHLAAQSSWYVVQVHAHAETKAQMHLTRQGFETYVPRYLKRRRHARRTDTVAAPLYPAYLFVRFDPSDPSMALDSFDCRRGAAGLQRRRSRRDWIRRSSTV